MDIHTLLVFGHIAGTILGVGGATVAELNLLQALKARKPSADAKAMMHVNYTMIRVGTVLVVVSGLLLVWWHISQGNMWVLESPKVWVKEIITVLIVFNAVALSKRWVPLWLGASISLTSWWTATILGTWRQVPYSFWVILGTYVAAVFVVAGILHIIRKMYTKRV